MEITKRYFGMWRYIRVRWPTYLFGIGGGFVAGFAIIWVCIHNGWLSFAFLTLGALIILGLFFVTSTWSAHQLYDQALITRALVTLGKLSGTEEIVQIELGERWQADELCHHFTTGHLDVIDVYNPNITPDRTLARTRQLFPRPISDPRVTWRDGSMNLLPLPDDSVITVIIIEGVSKFWQKGDQDQILGEIRRILREGGQLLIAERTRTLGNFLALGIAGFHLPTLDYWAQILVDNGFQITDQFVLRDQMICYKAVKQKDVLKKRLGRRVN